MHLAIRRYRFEPGNLDAIVERAQTGFVPILAGAPGFLAFYIVDAGDGVGLSISVFENEEGAEASTRMAASWVRENLAPLLPEPPTVTEGEVLVYEVA